MKQMVVSIFCQFHTCALLVLTLFEVAGEGSSHGPSYTAEPRHCYFDHECDARLGHSCVQMYQGCHMGTCMCDPLNYIYTLDNGLGKCIPKKLGGETCTPKDKCPDSMDCIRGRCACVSGIMTSDQRFCMEDNYRMLGESCRPGDTCFHITPRGYRYDILKCTPHGTCECDKGYKTEGETCKSWGLGEMGCKLDYQCDGGALCFRRQCRCPHGYTAVAGNTKCAKNDAIVNLGYGSICKETEELSYCNKGLVCYECGEEKHRSKCVRFILKNQSQASSPLTGGGQLTSRPMLYVLLLCVTSYLAVINIHAADR